MVSYSILSDHLQVDLLTKVKPLNRIHFTTINKKVLQMILVLLVGSDTYAKGSLMWEETVVHVGNPCVRGHSSNNAQVLADSEVGGCAYVYLACPINIQFEGIADQ